MCGDDSVGAVMPRHLKIRCTWQLFEIPVPKMATILVRFLVKIPFKGSVLPMVSSLEGPEEQPPYVGKYYCSSSFSSSFCKLQVVTAVDTKTPASPQVPPKPREVWYCSMLGSCRICNINSKSHEPADKPALTPVPEPCKL